MTQGRAEPARGVRLLVCVALVAALTVVATVPAGAAELDPEVPVAEAVERAVADGEVADVVVTLDEPPPGSPSGLPGRGRGRLQSLQRNAQAFVDSLPPAVDRPAVAARASRFVALRVDAAGLDALRANPSVASVAPNERRRLSLVDSTPTVGAPLAWQGGYTGSGTAVAVLDTGVQADHPFLVGRVVGEACFSGGGYDDPAVDSLCTGDADWDEGAGTGAPCPMPECSHGTHVAGIAAGAAAPPGAPSSGVAPGADIVSVMVATRIVDPSYCRPALQCLTLFDSDILAALDWVQANHADHGIAAVNMSFGGGRYEGICDAEPDADLQSYADRFDELRQLGIAPVVASGNESFTDELAAPACLSSAVAVGAVASSTVKVTSWSNSSDALDLLAPGATTNSTGIRSSVPGSAYGSIAGTSMAAPHVAGAFAVLRAARPGSSVAQIEALLVSSGRPVTDSRQGRTSPLIQLDEAIPRAKGTYHPVTPTRLLDTRSGLGAPQAKVGAGKRIDLEVGGRGGVPSSGVAAVVLNVTYVLPTSTGFVVAWPHGTLRPEASNLNLNPGDARPNLVTVRMGAGGKVSLYNAVGSVDLVADVAGWYDDGSGSTGSRFHPVAPKRVVDTRDGTGAPKAKVGPGGRLTIDVDDVAGSPVPDGATAVTVNLTGTGATAGTHVTAYPADLTVPPVASNLNLSAGQTRPNLAIVPLDATGKLALSNNAGSVDLIVDVLGWYDGSPTGQRFVAKAPTRLLDTRKGLAGPVGAGATVDLSVGGVAGIPAGTPAVVMNVTSTRATAGGYVVVFPDGIDPPFASNLNLEVGRDVPNLVTTTLAANGKASFYNRIGTVHLVADVAGWFEA